MKLDYTNCKLYNLRSKKKLMKLIGIQDRRYLSQRYISSLVFSYIQEKNLKGKGPRLIEKPKLG